METVHPRPPSCMDCRWLDIQVDAGRELFWCFKRGKDVTRRVWANRVCRHYGFSEPRTASR